MANLKRYSIVMRSDSDVYEIEDSPTGEWVKFADTLEGVRERAYNSPSLPCISHREGGMCIASMFGPCRICAEKPCLLSRQA